MGKKYNNIVEFIDKCKTQDEINSARAQVSAYRMQSGGHNAELKYEIDTLMVAINNKEREILKL